MRRRIEGGEGMKIEQGEKMALKDYKDRGDELFTSNINEMRKALGLEPIENGDITYTNGKTINETRIEYGFKEIGVLENDPTLNEVRIKRGLPPVQGGDIIRVFT